MKEEDLMPERMKKDDVARRLATRMNTDEATATAWVDGVIETLYEAFKAGESVTLPGFGGFFVRPEPKQLGFQVQSRPALARALWLVINIHGRTLNEQNSETIPGSTLCIRAGTYR